MKKAEGIIRRAPIIVPIARPRPQDGRMYQSFIFIICFIVYSGGGCLYLFMY